MKATSTLGCLIAIVVVIGVYKSTAHPDNGSHLTIETRGPDQDPRAAARDQQARGDLGILQGCVGKPASMACGVARGHVISEIHEAFDTVTQVYDPRVIDQALHALDSASTALQVDAVRYLGRVAIQDPDRHVETLIRLVKLIAGTRSLQVGHEAARALVGSPLRDLGQRWLDHHKDFPHDELAAAYYQPVPTPDLAKLGFTTYANAIPYSPADTDRSLGYATHDPVDKVAAFFAKQAGTPAIDPGGWQQFMMTAFQHEMDPRANQPSAADLAEIQRLNKEYQRTKDPALLQKVGAIMSAPRPLGPLGSRKPNGMVTGAYLRYAGDGRAFVIKKLPDHIALMAFVYPEPAFKVTVIEYAWSLVEADPLAPLTAP